MKKKERKRISRLWKELGQSKGNKRLLMKCTSSKKDVIVVRRQMRINEAKGFVSDPKSHSYCSFVSDKSIKTSANLLQ